MGAHAPALPRFATTSTWLQWNNTCHRLLYIMALAGRSNAQRAKRGWPTWSENRDCFRWITHEWSNSLRQWHNSNEIAHNEGLRLPMSSWELPRRRIYSVYDEILVIYDVFDAVIYAVLCCHCYYSMLSSMLSLCCHCKDPRNDPQSDPRFSSTPEEADL